MKEELNLPCHHKVFVVTSKNSYSFLTDTNAEYHVFFQEVKDIASGTTLADSRIYFISVDKVKKGNGKGKDSKLKEAILCILQYFFKDVNRILSFVYESSDGRQNVRKRLFRAWEETVKGGTIRKQDYSIDTEDNTYEVGVIYHSENSLGSESIISAIDSVIYILTTDKEE